MAGVLILMRFARFLTGRFSLLVDITLVGIQNNAQTTSNPSNINLRTLMVKAHAHLLLSVPSAQLIIAILTIFAVFPIYTCQQVGK